MGFNVLLCILAPYCLVHVEALSMSLSYYIILFLPYLIFILNCNLFFSHFLSNICISTLFAHFHVTTYLYKNVLRNMFLTRNAEFRRSTIACILPLKKLGALEVLFRQLYSFGNSVLLKCFSYDRLISYREIHLSLLFPTSSFARHSGLENSLVV